LISFRREISLKLIERAILKTGNFFKIDPL